MAGAKGVGYRNSIRSRNKSALKLPVLSGQQVIFLLDDEFLTNEAAPIASPRTCEPGPGTLTIVQTDGELSIAGQELVFPAPATPAWGDNGYYSSVALTPTDGIAHIVYRVDTPESFSQRFAQFRSTAALSSAGEAFGRTGFLLSPKGDYRINYAHVNGIFAVIVNGTNVYYIYDDHLIYMLAGNNTPLYPMFSNNAEDGSFHFVRVAKMPSPYKDANGLLLQNTATVTDGQTFTANKNATIFFTWTPVANEVLNVRYRRVDDDNCMILRCDQANGWIRIYKRQAAVETQISTAAMVWTPATAYPMWLRFTEIQHDAGRDVLASTALLTTDLEYFNLNQSGVKIDGSSGVTDLKIIPYFLTGKALSYLNEAANPFKYKTRPTTNLADGGDINAALTALPRGGILNLAAGGTYAFAGGVNGFSTIPNGFSDTYRTVVNGNGATVTGGANTIYALSKRYFELNNMIVADGTTYTCIINKCRNFVLSNLTMSNNAGAALDVSKYDTCTNFLVTDCHVDPSIGAASLDAFEMYGNSGNGRYVNCVAHGVINGFEAWTGNAPNWINYDISFTNCEAYDCTTGFSCEGGAQSAPHENILCDGCSSHDNSEYGYQGIDGATLYRQNCTAADNLLGETNGSVVDL